MPKQVRTDILTAHDPLARTPTPSTDPGNVDKPTNQHAGDITAEPVPETQPTRRDPAAAPTSTKSSILIDYAKPDYQLLKEAARRQGLNLRAYIRKVTIEQAEADLSRSDTT